MATLNLFFRWLHVFAGIIWIGHLYFFNFVNVPLQGVLDDAAKKSVNPHLQPRALWWFRWGAMLTFLAGLVLFSLIYMYTPGMGWGPNALFRDETGLTDRAVWILFGMLLGTIMWFNVWFVIWPTQKRILGGGATPEELPALRKRALLFSRTNSYLSGPMLFGMLAANHYDVGVNAFAVLLFSAIGAAGIWVAIFHSGKVGKSV
jgi:uncharacterized membrane protein